MIDEWAGLYGGAGWKGLIVPEAFSHPAKVSRKLAARIWQHVLDEGWIHSGGIVEVTASLRDEIIGDLDLDGIPYQE
jgi:hypothetical protein